MEGLIGRLLDEEDATVRNLRRAATFYCIPNMNPGKLTLRALFVDVLRGSKQLGLSRNYRPTMCCHNTHTYTHIHLYKRI